MLDDAANLQPSQRHHSVSYVDVKTELKSHPGRSLSFPLQTLQTRSVTDNIRELPRPSYNSCHVCEICEELLLHGEDRQGARLKYNNPLERYASVKLLEAAKKGCALASICVTATAAFIKNPIAPTLSMVKTDPDSIFRFAIYTGEPDTIIELYEHPDDPSPWPLIAPARDVSIDSTQDDCYERIGGWIKDCKETHELCNLDYSDDPPTLPKRVIDVGVEGSKIKLVEIEGEYRPYTALTYCWGDDRDLSPIKLLLSRHDDYHKEIPMQLLPQTLLDAVNITRRLGMQYLWIDALCILQDSPADWAIGSSRMSNIYTAAVVVIAATGAQGCKDGCFIGNRKKVDLPYTDETGQEKTLYARLAQFPFFDDRADVRSDPHSLGEGPLSRRGWCFQEVVLARRTLSYSKDEVLWDCMERISCECRLDGSIRHEHRSRRPSMTPQLTSYSPFLELFEEARTVPSAADTHKLYAKWYAMLEEYTGRNLTYPSDRLPAFSGLATLMADVNRDTYHAGIWKSQLPYGLLWARQSRMSHEHIRVRGGWAPTWSWASIMARIRQEAPVNFTSGLDLISIDTTPSGANVFGSVKAATLTLSAVLVPVTLDLVSIKKTMEENIDHVFEWQGTAHVVYNSHLKQHRMKILLDLGETWLPQADSDEDLANGNELEVADRQALFLMFVGSERDENGQDQELPRFLVVNEIDGVDGIRSFERVGISPRIWEANAREVLDRQEYMDLALGGTKEIITLQ